MKGSSKLGRRLGKKLKRELERKERIARNKGMTTKPGFFGDGSKVNWLYK